MTMTFKVSAPAVSDASVAEHQTQVVVRSVGALQELIERLSPEELELVSEHLEGLADDLDAEPSPQTELINRLTGGRQYSQEERLRLHLSTLLRSFRFRRKLLAGSLTTTQVAELLGTSRQTPHDRLRKGTLLAEIGRAHV